MFYKVHIVRCGAIDDFLLHRIESYFLAALAENLPICIDAESSLVAAPSLRMLSLASTKKRDVP